MRKPRDIDAELKALAEKAKGLKAKRILQLGELVTLTGADALDHATLAGALLQAVAEKDASAKEGWKRAGEAFFLGRARIPKVRAGKSSGKPGDDAAGSSPHGDGGAAG